MRDIDEISGDVIDAAMQLHRDLGPGLLESVYEVLLASKLVKLHYQVERQKPINIEYDGDRFDGAFKNDLLVDGQLIVEIKSVERIGAAHQKLLLTYLRLTRQPVGLLLNFGGAMMKDGIQRVVMTINPPRLRASA